MLGALVDTEVFGEGGVGENFLRLEVGWSAKMVTAAFQADCGGDGRSLGGGSGVRGRFRYVRWPTVRCGRAGV